MVESLYAPTHEVFNQSPPLANVNLFACDPALMEATAREGAGAYRDDLLTFGAKLGSAEVIELGNLAHRYPPTLRSFDRFGNRRDEIDFHHAWHDLMTLAIGAGLHSHPWANPEPGAHVARAAAYIMQAQIESGVQCPITMTYGVVPALKKQPDLAQHWLPKIYDRRYDPGFKPATEKTSVLFGMGMTEKQGGSDVRANTTQATPMGPGGPASPYRIVGHKWFFSAPMCDAFLILAQAPSGLSCFLLPRWLPDGTLNAIRIQRLKEKLGNKSNASSEVEFQGATAWMVGEEGRGVPTIIEMGNYTRLDCATGTTGLMRGALAQAVNHARYRSAFQKRLIDQPLMTNVLADLAVEVEAATALAMRVARAFDRQDDPAEGLFRRIMTPAAKYWICKRGANVGVEAMEVMGGNGYVEEGPLGRIYREMPLNSIWEGSGNIMCLDMLRALFRSPDSISVVEQELSAARGADRRYDRFVDALYAEFTNRADFEARARRLTERLSLAVQGSLLVRHAPTAVADAFCASRLDGEWGHAFGTLPAGIDHRAIAERALAA